MKHLAAVMMNELLMFTIHLHCTASVYSQYNLIKHICGFAFTH